MDDLSYIKLGPGRYRVSATFRGEDRGSYEIDIPEPFGVQSIPVPRGDDVKREQLEGGLNFIEYTENEIPQEIDLTAPLTLLWIVTGKL